MWSQRPNAGAEPQQRTPTRPTPRLTDLWREDPNLGELKCGLGPARLQAGVIQALGSSSPSTVQPGCKTWSLKYNIYPARFSSAVIPLVLCTCLSASAGMAMHTWCLFCSASCFWLTGTFTTGEVSSASQMRLWNFKVILGGVKTWKPLYIVYQKDVGLGSQGKNIRVCTWFGTSISIRLFFSICKARFT